VSKQEAAHTYSKNAPREKINEKDPSTPLLITMTIMGHPSGLAIYTA
jgi:hypothetical protein